MKAANSPFDISPSRLRIKKVARRLAVGLGRSLPRRRKLGDGSVRVLTYHRFGESRLDPCCLTPQAFGEQLDWLTDHANLLTPDRFDAVMQGKQAAPADAILISIDDGHHSVATHALPALDRRGLKAVLFVCPALVDSANSLDDSAERFMDWKALAAAAASGHTIASHGYSHRSLGRLSLSDAVDEIERAGAMLVDKLGGSGDPFFSFPFGTRADYSTALADRLAERGLRYCFTSAHGRCLPRPDSVLLPRIKIEGGNEQDLFPHIVRGCIDHWRFVDSALFLLQQRGRM